MGKTRKRIRIGRNEACPCGSGSKFKVCHGRAESSILRPSVRHYIDHGEDAIRWVISSATGTAFFVDAEGRILVFSSRELATRVAQHELFADSEPGEINVAGVGPTKWAHLQETLPFVEVENYEEAVAMIQARIESLQQAQGSTEPVPPPTPEGEANG